MSIIVQPKKHYIVTIKKAQITKESNIGLYINKGTYFEKYFYTDKNAKKENNYVHSRNLLLLHTIFVSCIY